MWLIYYLYVQLYLLNIPIRSDENDPFINGFDNMKIATTFPTTPNIETMDNRIPSIINANMVDFPFYQQNSINAIKLKYLVCLDK